VILEKQLGGAMPMDAVRKAVNVVAVLLNNAVIKKVTICLGENQRPSKIIAAFAEGEDPELIAAIFSQDLCGHGCSTVGVEADVVERTVTIDRALVHDKQAFDMVAQALVALGASMGL
jgi:hypothetical protein